MGYSNGELFDQLRKLSEDPDFKLTNKQSLQLMFAGLAGLRERIDAIDETREKTLAETNDALLEVKSALEQNTREHVDFKKHLPTEKEKEAFAVISTFLTWVLSNKKQLISGIIIVGILLGFLGSSIWHVPDVRKFILETLQLI